MIKNLVLSGGGIKGFCFIGVLDLLYSEKILNNVHTFIGTSIGSLISMLLCLNYEINEIKYFISNFDFKKLEPTLSSNSSMGLDNGIKLNILIKHLIKYKIDNENITLLELYQLFNNELIVSVTCLTDQNICYFNYKNEPNLPVWLAVRMSTCVPAIYEPILYKNKLYIDGGGLDNFPIQLVNINNTLGITIFDDQVNEIENVYDYFKVILDCITRGHDKAKIRNCHKNVIKINASQYSFLKFDIEENIIQEMYQLGSKYAEDFLDKYYNQKYDLILTDCILDEILLESHSIFH